ncbi:hypothetical protein ABD76_18650 [Paenibacillus dendritiformis]|nr:hypothetical protein [Paenibacillus dendritiformis]
MFPVVNSTKCIVTIIGALAVGIVAGKMRMDKLYILSLRSFRKKRQIRSSHTAIVVAFGGGNGAIGRGYK